MTPEQIDKLCKWLGVCNYKQNAELYYTFENGLFNSIGEVYCEHCKHGLSHPIHIDPLSPQGFEMMMGKVLEKMAGVAFYTVSDGVRAVIYAKSGYTGDGWWDATASTPAEALALAILNMEEGR